VSSFWVWGVALLVYVPFLAWSLNWRGRLSRDEVEAYMARISAVYAGAQGDLDVMRRFLMEDDGRAFFMLNLVRIAPGEVADPRNGAMRPAGAVMRDYGKQFLRSLLARGGYPAIAARKVGGYLDGWGVEADPGWTLMGYMRYRSRRDLAELVCDVRFAGAHDFKFAAMPNTFSFPTRPRIMMLASPGVWVGLVIALVAALAQVGLLLYRAV